MESKLPCLIPFKGSQCETGGLFLAWGWFSGPVVANKTGDHNDFPWHFRSLLNYSLSSSASPKPTSRYREDMLMMSLLTSGAYSKDGMFSCHKHLSDRKETAHCKNIPNKRRQLGPELWGLLYMGQQCEMKCPTSQRQTWAWTMSVMWSSIHPQFPRCCYRPSKPHFLKCIFPS